MTIKSSIILRKLLMLVISYEIQQQEAKGKAKKGLKISVRIKAIVTELRKATKTHKMR